MAQKKIPKEDPKELDDFFTPEKSTNKVEEETKEKEEVEEIEDLEEEINLREFIGKVFIIESARIDQGQSFNIVRMRINVDGQEYDVRTTSKAIENTIKNLIEKGLNQGKKFRVCLQTRKSRYATEMLVLVSPSVCEKVK